MYGCEKDGIKKQGMIICNLGHKKWEVYVIFLDRCNKNGAFFGRELLGIRRLIKLLPVRAPFGVNPIRMIDESSFDIFMLMPVQIVWIETYIENFIFSLAIKKHIELILCGFP